MVKHQITFVLKRCVLGQWDLSLDSTDAYKVHKATEFKPTKCSRTDKRDWQKHDLTRQFSSTKVQVHYPRALIDIGAKRYIL